MAVQERPQDDVTAAIASARLVPVIVLDDAARASSVATALVAGGLPIAEVTLRTPAAEDAIRTIAKDSDMVLGAGTVTRPEQVARAMDAGARFIVTPGFSRGVVRACKDRGIPVFPGVATATEIQMALDEGLEIVKFFPAETAGGVAALKALSAPYSMMRFIPTGGVTAKNLPDYLALPSVLAVGGSWMVAPALIAAGNLDQVRRLTAEAVGIVRSSRPPDA
jgi:2-dehydro-3-deoxyphosphogluconate aldolase / (4S)-4-hydroxy-2-oxoglutarate aldolase